MTPREFGVLFGQLVAAYPQREISPTTIAVFTERLSGMDARLFAAAVDECIDTHDWMPSVNQVRQAAARVLARAGVLPPTGADAWASVLEVARTWVEGAPIADRLPDAVRAALSVAGGIRAVAMAGSEWEVHRVEQRFIAAYDQYRGGLVAAALRDTYTEQHALGGTQRSGGRVAIAERGSSHAAR